MGSIDKYIFRTTLASFALVLVSLTVALAGARWFYIVAAVLLGIWLVKKGIEAGRLRTEQSFRGLFGYSIVYLFGLFSAMILDSAVRSLF